MSEEDETKVLGYTKAKLYELIPQIYRQHDAISGKPLEALISIIARQVDVLEKDIAGLYDNWFVETCDEWVTAYLADLVGARSLATSRVSSTSATTAEVSQRAYVANTLGYRRRKGTLAMIEQLAKDITRWDSHAVEFFQLLGTTQHLNHLRLQNQRTPDLRKSDVLELLNTPFDTIAHTVEVRRIASGRGYYNIPNVGMFLWRLRAFPSQDTPAHLVEESVEPSFVKNQCFAFNPLGYDEPIFNTPVTEAELSGISGEINVSAPIRIRALFDNLRSYYGRSFSITVRYEDNPEQKEIPVKHIEVCNLATWRKPGDGKVAVDPVLGRIRLAKNAADVHVVYYYGFSGKMGGGFYTRQESKLESATTYKVSKRKVFAWSKIPSDMQETDLLRAMLRNDYSIDWIEAATVFANDGTTITGVQGTHSLSITMETGRATAKLQSDGMDVATLYPRETGTTIYVSQETDLYDSVNEALVWWNENRDTKAVIEIVDSEVYKEGIVVRLPAGSSLEIRGRQEERPILQTIEAQGEKGSKLILDGLWLDDSTSRSLLKVQPGDMESIAIRHCTLVPDRDPSNRDLAIELKSYIRRRLCSWDNIMQPDEGAKLQKFLELKLGQKWVPKNARFERITDDQSGKEHVRYVSSNQQLRIELGSGVTEEVIATLSTKKKGHEDWKKVYEFYVLTQSGKKIMYLEGGNDNLQIRLERSICGRINTLNSLIFTWNKVPSDVDESRNLRDFLKSNFNLDWLSDETPFVRVGDNKIEVTSSDSSHSLALTNYPDEKRVMLAIDGKEAEKFLAIGESVYCQSDARLSVEDSVIDGKGEEEAIVSRTTTLEQATVFGKTVVDELSLASNSILTDTVYAKIDQKGCVRFSYIPLGSRTPRKYKCQPSESSPDSKPSFTSTVYGDPGYAQLHRNVDIEIFEGADNAAEMGAFNHLLQPQRMRDLKSALNEYLRFGLEPGVFLVT
jgi:hypothetical protein